jgi:hypothetical protein
VIPHYPELKPLQIGDRLWIAKKLKKSGGETCELTLGNIFIWRNFDRTRITCLNENICMLICQPDEPPYFLPPIGNRLIPETVATLCENVPRMSRAPKSFTRLLDSSRYSFLPLRQQFDYLYLRSALAELKGKKYDGKRNHLKRFKSAHSLYRYLPLNVEQKSQALALFERWFRIREESKFFPRLAYTSQKAAVSEALENFNELHLRGGCLLSGNEFLGFTLGSEINPESFAVHFLYGDPAAPGISQTLLREACTKTYLEYKYIDLEQDLGIPGLRTAKLSYHPLRLEEKYEIRPLS